MSDNLILPPDAREENAKQLAAALGISVEEADQQLDAPIVVTVAPDDHVAQKLAEEAIALLSRTFTTVTDGPLTDAAVELLIGAVAPRTSGKVIIATVEAERLTIGTATAQVRAPAESRPPRLLLLIGACYISAAVLKQVAGGIPHYLPDPFVLNFDEFGIRPEDYSTAIHLGETHLAGAGAIGNGLLWAARHLDFRGNLHVVDDDVVDGSNLQRQIYFMPEDEGQPKVTALVGRAAPLLPRLTLIPHQTRLQALGNPGAWLHRLISAVDSPEARRALQKEMPGEVFDASTTGIEAVVIHHHRNPTETACMACVYQRSATEMSQQQHMADHLGISLEQVMNNRIDQAMATAISARFPTIEAAALVGLACDSIYKRLCGAGVLTTPAGKQILAPFAFVSVLAGALLAIELLRRVGLQAQGPFNIWRTGCWSPPSSRLWRIQRRSPDCEVCRDEGLLRVSQILWGANVLQLRGTGA